MFWMALSARWYAAQEQFDIVTRPRAHRQCFAWLCRSGGMRLKNSSTLLRGREHIDNVLDGFVGAVVCGSRTVRHCYAAASTSTMFWMALSARWYAASSLLFGRWWGSGRLWKQLLAIGPQRRLWKNKNSSATWTPLAVRR